MPPQTAVKYALAVVGTGNFAANLTALCANFGLETVLFVDEFRTGKFQGKPVLAAANLVSTDLHKIDKWVIAISTADYRQAAIERLSQHGVPRDRIFALTDDPDLQILRLLFEEHDPAGKEKFMAAGCGSITQMEDAFLRQDWTETLASLPAERPTVGLGYYGRGGGFRRHISSLIPLLSDRFNVVTMSDEVMNRAEEAPRHLYLSATAACQLEQLDLVLSAHVFPCSRPEVPRVSFSHVIYDFNLTFSACIK